MPSTGPQKPPHIREFTLRSISVGLLVALVIGASYPYMVLKFGFGPNISVVSAFFGFMALGLLSKSYNRWENNVVQTAGTSAGQVAFLCWLLAAREPDSVVFNVTYRPLAWFVVRAPNPIGRALIKYANFAVPSDGEWVCYQDASTGQSGIGYFEESWSPSPRVFEMSIGCSLADDPAERDGE